MSVIENITLGQIAAFVIFVSGLYLGVKTLKKELKEALTKTLSSEFNALGTRFDNDEKRIKALEEQNAFFLKAISLLLQDDLAILEHLRTNNNTGEMAKQQKKVQNFLVER